MAYPCIDELGDFPNDKFDEFRTLTIYVHSLILGIVFVFCVCCNYTFNK